MRGRDDMDRWTAREAVHAGGAWTRTRRLATRIALAIAWSVGAAAGAGAQASSSDGLLDRPAHLEVSDAALGDALRSLQRTSGVALAYSPDLLPSEATVSCACTIGTVRDALDELLKDTGLVYRASGRQVLIGRRPGGTSVAEGFVVGVVIDEVDGRPLQAAEVRAGQGRAAATGSDGGFRLTAPAAFPLDLTVRSIGYDDRTVTVTSADAPLRIGMVARPIPLEEIVIAPGRFGVLDVQPSLVGSTVSREDIEAIPQFGDDVFRTLKRMPGVTSDDISTRLNVRGGTDRDLLVRLDGLELFEPYHLKDLDGALGIVDVQALGGVDLVTGGFPAEYGDKTAGVFEMYSRRPPLEGRRTTLGLSLSSVSAISQGTLADGRGQWLVSLRRGFLEYALAVTDVDDDIKPTYWDALARLQYAVSDRHLVWGEMLYGGDDMRWHDEETASLINSGWSNGYGWAGWKAQLGDGVRAETIVSVGHLSRSRVGDMDNPNGGAFTPLSASVDDEASFDFGGVRQDWQLDVGDDHAIKLGFDLRRTRGTYDYFNESTRYDVSDTNQLYRRSDTTRVALDPVGSEIGSYASLRGRTGGPVTWEVGVRHDWQQYTHDSDFAPRFLLRVDLDRRTSVKGSWGRYFQSQPLHELEVQDGVRSFSPSERAEQIAVGVERDLGSGWSGRVEGYLRTIDDPRPEYVNLARAVNPILEVESDRTAIVADEARARGIELIVANDGSRGSFSASYALASTENLVDGRWAPRTLDQRHTLNLRGAVRLGGAWQLSGSWQYHTGWPFTRQILDIEATLSEDGTEEVSILRRGFGPLNAERLPAYHRLDLRLTRAFELQRSHLEVYLDVFNAYNRTNLRGYYYYLQPTAYGFETRHEPGEEQLPILPTLGFRWIF